MTFQNSNVATTPTYDMVLESMDMRLSQLLTDARNVALQFNSSVLTLAHFISAALDTSDEFRAMIMRLGKFTDDSEIQNCRRTLSLHMYNSRQSHKPDSDEVVFDKTLWEVIVAMYQERARYRLRNMTIALLPAAVCATSHDLLFVLQTINLVPGKLAAARQLTPEWLSAYTAYAPTGEANEQFKLAAQSIQQEKTAGVSGEPSQYPFTDMYTINLNKERSAEDAAPIIGRDAEIQRAINVLSCMHQNNPMLVGEPGTGRRSVVKGIVSRIINGQVPQLLKNKRVLKLDTASLKAGASVAGALEDRLKNLLAEMRAAKDVILVVEDVHMLAKSTSAQDMSISTMLMPSLSRGELRCIGITAPSNYNNDLKANRTVSQLFIKLDIEPSSKDETLAILRGLKSGIEAFHGVEINDNALRVAVDLSARYIQDRNLPEKAISLIDSVAAKLSIAMSTKPDRIILEEQRLARLTMELKAVCDESTIEAKEEVIKLEAEIKKSEKLLKDLNQQLDDERLALTNIQDLHRRREQLERQLITAREKQDIQTQAVIEYKELPDVDFQIKHVQDFKNNKRFMLINASVTDKEVSEQISVITGVPVAKMLQSEKERLLRMASVLSDEVVGQDQAVQAITRVVQRRRAGIKVSKSPIGSFLLLGPTGTGKTQITKAVARFMFDTEDSLIRLDMGEYKESHKIATLFGAPPGYVGYEEGGVLSEAVRKRPYSVILLDEVEKAHPDIFNVFLPIMDEGYATDSQGRKIDFTNTLIIMTSNLGANDILKMDGAPEEDVKSFVMGEVRKFFKAELIARMNEIVVFNGLKRKDANRIVQGFLKDLYRGLAEKRITLAVTDAAVEQIIEEGYSSANGARFLRKAVTDNVEDLLSLAVLKDEVVPGGSYVVDYIDNAFVCKPK
jgi:ATP-dependent Clp protease ATP-binding subunit ClpB